MSANRSFRADAAAFCAKREDNLSHAATRQALVGCGTTKDNGILKLNCFDRVQAKE